MKLIIELKLWCPYCGQRHVDETRNGERWDRRAHTTHRCQSCGKDFDVYVSGAGDEVLTVGRESEPVKPSVRELVAQLPKDEVDKLHGAVKPVDMRTITTAQGIPRCGYSIDGDVTVCTFARDHLGYHSWAVP